MAATRLIPAAPKTHETNEGPICASEPGAGQVLSASALSTPQGGSMRRLIAATAAGTAEGYGVHGIPNLPVDVCVNGALGTVVAIVRNAVLGGCMTVVGSRGGWCRVRGVRSAGRGHSPGRTARRSCTRSPAPTVQPDDAGGGRVVGHGRGCDTGLASIPRVVLHGEGPRALRASGRKADERDRDTARCHRRD